jgi:hypothetical protein
MTRNHPLIAIAAALVVVLLLSGTAAAAQFESGEVYRLEPGEVVEDDLYVTGNQVIIDGTVQGDLIAAGNVIEINGTVEEDAILAAGGIIINGTVQDDIRMAAGGIELAGTVGDDVVMAAGGGNTPMPAQFNEQPIPQGITMAERAVVGGDAVIGGAEGTIDGTIENDLYVGMAQFTLAAEVGGDAQIESDFISVLDEASVAGTLRYTSDERATIPAGVAEDVNYNATADEDPTLQQQLVSWLVRTALILVGFALLGWLTLRFAPRLLTRPASTINNKPVAVGLAGFAAAILFIFIPLASALLVFLMVVFGGWFPGLVLGIFLFGSLALLWFLSPLVTGLWIGKRVTALLGRQSSNISALLTGVVLLVLPGGVPILGWFVYLLSFIFAIGSLIVLASRVQQGEQGQATPQAA